jgi:hypothetical protein
MITANIFSLATISKRQHLLTNPDRAKGNQKHFTKYGGGSATLVEANQRSAALKCHSHVKAATVHGIHTVRLWITRPSRSRVYCKGERVGSIADVRRLTFACKRRRTTRGAGEQRDIRRGNDGMFTPRRVDWSQEVVRCDTMVERESERRVAVQACPLADSNIGMAAGEIVELRRARSRCCWAWTRARVCLVQRVMCWSVLWTKEADHLIISILGPETFFFCYASICCLAQVCR